MIPLKPYRVGIIRTFQSKIQNIMKSNLEREVRILKIYALATTLLFSLLLFSAFNSNRNPKFEEIDVERINIVEKDGSLKMVISNQERQHPGIANGKLIVRETARPPGMLFFNHVGDEMGGLVFGENGDSSHWGGLTFDKFGGDQTMGFRYLESNNGAYSSGLQMWQQPNIPGELMQEKIDSVRKIEDKEQRMAAWQRLREKGELTTDRLFLGKNRDDYTVLVMQDLTGKPRIQMYVTPEGEAKLEFLDDKGNVMQSFPESQIPEPPGQPVSNSVNQEPGNN